LAGATLPDLTPETPLAALGLDSLQRVEFMAALDKTFACRLPEAVFNQARTLGELARVVEEYLIDNPRPDIPPARYLPNITILSASPSTVS